MSGYSRRPKKLPPPRTIEEAAERVHAGIIKMFDKGDGQGVIWETLAQVLFEAALTMADKRPGPQMQYVLHRAEAGLYDRLAGNTPDGLPGPEMAAPAPTIDNTGMRPTRAPQPRLKP